MPELRAAWPKPWDGYIVPACWIKRTLPDMALSGNLSPFELLFSRKLQIAHDTLVPHVCDTELSAGLDAFIDQLRQILRDSRQALCKRRRDEVASRRKVNAKIARPSPGLSVRPADLVLVKAISNHHRHKNRGTLDHETWKTLWNVGKIFQRGLNLEAACHGR